MASTGEKIAQFVSSIPPKDESGGEASAMLVKWTLVAEWMGADGDRYYVRRAGNGAGEGIAPGDFKGLLLEALVGNLLR